MSKNQRLFTCSPVTVFGVLNQGWLYATWVVGASRIRGVNPGWPAEGTEIHHSVGSWPLLIDDTTTVQKCVPNELLILRARAWPGGEADLVIEITPAPGGCRVAIYEDAVSGPAKLVPAPVRHRLWHWRNNETLQRLAFIAEGQAKNEAS